MGAKQTKKLVTIGIRSKKLEKVSAVHIGCCEWGQADKKLGKNSPLYFFLLPRVIISRGKELLKSAERERINYCFSLSHALYVKLKKKKIKSTKYYYYLSFFVV